MSARIGDIGPSLVVATGLVALVGFPGYWQPMMRHRGGASTGSGMLVARKLLAT
jgi:hypothetical protein